MMRTQALGASYLSPLLAPNTRDRTMAIPSAKFVDRLRLSRDSIALRRLDGPSCARRSKCTVASSPKVTTPTRTQSCPMVRRATKRLMKFVTRDQFWFSMLPEASMANARSIAAHAGKTIL